MLPQSTTDSGFRLSSWLLPRYPPESDTFAPLRPMQASRVLKMMGSSHWSAIGQLKNTKRKTKRSELLCASQNEARESGDVRR